MSLFVWSDVDLDGAGSILALSWFVKRTLPNKITTSRSFRRDFTNWYRNEGHNFKKIFICDLDVSSCIDIVDQSNIFIIDHHDSHITESVRYQKATTLIRSSSSTTKLIYDTYRDSMKLSKEQKLLVNLIDDYDSYNLSLPYSEQLNRLYWGLTGDRVQKFIDSLTRDDVYDEYDERKGYTGMFKENFTTKDGEDITIPYKPDRNLNIEGLLQLFDESDRGIRSFDIREDQFKEFEV